MNWIIIFNKQSESFIEKNNIPKSIIFEYIQKALLKLSGQVINIEIEKLKGKWVKFYRIRSGKIKIIVDINFKDLTVYIEKIDFRGDVYKILI